MKTTTAVIFYIITSLGAIIGLLALIKLPSIVFIGVEDRALSVLFYISSIFVILKSVIDISHFFLEKLGLYSVLHLENRHVFFDVEQLRKEMDLQQEINRDIWKDMHTLYRMLNHGKIQNNENSAEAEEDK